MCSLARSINQYRARSQRISITLASTNERDNSLGNGEYSFPTAYRNKSKLASGCASPSSLSVALTSQMSDPTAMHASSNRITASKPATRCTCARGGPCRR